MISLLVPTFSRPQNIKVFVQAINETVQSPYSTEIIFGIHEDDQASMDTLNSLDSKVKVTLAVIDRYSDGKPHLSFLWNQIYEHAKGDILGFFGDDVVFRTKNWDSEIVQEYESDWKKLVSCNDCYIHGGEQAVLFFTHRKVHELVGFYMYPEFRRWFMDTFWDKVFRGLGKMKVRRDLQTAHYHPERFPERMDNVHREMDVFKRQDDLLWNSPAMKEKINKHIEILKNAQ